MPDELEMDVVSREIMISSSNVVLGLATALGINEQELETALNGDIIKQRLKAETQLAIDYGTCGAPYFVVDDEGFWGSDRIWMLRKWIESGGW